LGGGAGSALQEPQPPGLALDDLGVNPADNGVAAENAIVILAPDIWIPSSDRQCVIGPVMNVKRREYCYAGRIGRRVSRLFVYQ
jgi:hypothetical protein